MMKELSSGRMKADCLGKGEEEFICVMPGGDPLSKAAPVRLVC